MVKQRLGTIVQYCQINKQCYLGRSAKILTYLCHTIINGTIFFNDPLGPARWPDG